MIRLILVLLYLAVFFLFSIPVFLIEWIIGKRNPGLRDRSSRRILSAACRIATFLAGAHITVKGTENLPREQAALYIGNHRSYFDILVLYPLLPGVSGFMGKKELEKVPFLSNWMRLIHCLFLDRSDLKQGLETILKAVDLLKSGISVVIFPEGTRNKNASQADLLPFHEGSFKAATRSGAPVVPFVIHNTSSILEDHIPWIRSTDITVEFLSPIDVGTLDRKEQKTLGVRTSQLIREHLLP